MGSVCSPVVQYETTLDSWSDAVHWPHNDDMCLYGDTNYLHFESSPLCSQNDRASTDLGSNVEPCGDLESSLDSSKSVEEEQVLANWQLQDLYQSRSSPQTTGLSSLNGGQELIMLPQLQQTWDTYIVGPDISPSSRSPSRSIVCMECLEPFTSSKLLETHAVDTKHQSYVCPAFGCDKKYHRKSVLSRHVAAHKPSSGWRCDECSHSGEDKTFARKDHYMTHMRTIHKSETNHSDVDSNKKRKASSSVDKQNLNRPDSDTETNKTAIFKTMNSIKKRLGPEQAMDRLIERQLLEWGPASTQEFMHRLESELDQIPGAR